MRIEGRLKESPSSTTIPYYKMTSDESSMELIKVFELYSGIGGMHFALKETEIPIDVIRAIDINPVANTVYKMNFPSTVLLEKNIQGLTADDFDDLSIDMITMSPPCQPFTRIGLRRDFEDHRNFSILHIINLIPELKTVKYVLLENVKGFECSVIRNELVKSLENSNFTYQEFLLSPNQFSIPNSRLRYYLLAKRMPLEFCFTKRPEVLFELPELNEKVAKKVDKLNLKYKKLVMGNNSCFEIGLILCDSMENLLPDNVLGKYGSLLDVVTKKSISSCCFTKAYSRYIEGTGSIYTPFHAEDVQKVFAVLKKLDKGSDKYIDLLKSLKLRYFSPEEVSCLMSFPNTLKFPDDFSNRQKYKLLGNSINVHVVAVLSIILIS